MSKKAPTSIKRRDFLKTAGVGGVAGAAVVATGIGKADAAVEVDPKAGKGYRETSHIRTYYDLAKF